MERELPEELKKYYEDIKYVFGHHSTLPYPAFCTCVHKKIKKIVTIDNCHDGFVAHYKRLRIWLELLNHPCIRQLYYVHTGESAVYVVREHMEHHLKDAIVAQLLQPFHVKYIMYQLFRLFSYLHSANVICMTLRPIYIGINDDCEIKLVNQLPVAILPVSESDRSDDLEISDRWYQAPELILVDNYASLSTAMNMWTLGTIFAELLSYRPIFGDVIALSLQLIKIMNALGRPTEQDLIDIGSPKASSILEDIEPDDRRDFNEIIPNAPDDALDLLRKLLRWSPKNRITAEEALKHPFLAEIIQGNYGPHAMDPPTIIVPTYNEIKDRIQKNPNSSFEMIKEINSKIPPIVMFDTIANMKILAFNIARSSEACNLLLIELWQKIFASMEDNNSFGSYEKIAKQMYVEYKNRNYMTHWSKCWDNVATET